MKKDDAATTNLVPLTGDDGEVVDLSEREDFWANTMPLAGDAIAQAIQTNKDEKARAGRPLAHHVLEDRKMKAQEKPGAIQGGRYLDENGDLLRDESGKPIAFWKDLHWKAHARRWDPERSPQMLAAEIEARRKQK